MEKVKKVMVAIAFSEYAQGTFNFAAQFARGVDAELIVANVINSRDVASVETISAMGYDVDGSHYTQKVKEERRQLLDDIIAAAGYPRENVRTIFRIGNPIDELLKLILSENIDVIVMGPKGRTDLEHILVGSVAEKIFRRSPATIISYRGEKVAERLKKRIKHI
ncbi:universal stress protein [Desulfosarcina alkanivorans]|uniref:Universal stress protein n=1 Tax=Desulfosarcina alkanivorans TaxID=571177 RepID=A0A5K7YQY8_9BACT|nr:universal stress protein [Desulfosarcina alkanivorans]BBO68714.1 universal stress protein [Desulfosarcina alkanivorans]